MLKWSIFIGNLALACTLVGKRATSSKTEELILAYARENILKNLKAMSALLIIALLFGAGSTSYASEFKKLRDTFGDWKVRHVYNEETLLYRFSDAKTFLAFGGDKKLPVQINRTHDGKFEFRIKYGFGRWGDWGAFGAGQWITKIVIYIDGNKFEYSDDDEEFFVHEFIAQVDNNFLKVLATSSIPATVQIYSKSALVGTATLPVRGSAAAMVWLRAIKGDALQRAETPLQSLTKRAEKGDPASQVSLGIKFYVGSEVERDFVRAASWIRKAAEQGNREGQRALAILYKQGKAVPQDYKEALKWYRKAAEQNLAVAQYGLALMYAEGQGTAIKVSEAEHWYKKAIEQGHSEAKNSLAFLWADNNKNLDEAEKFAREMVSQAPNNPAYLDTLGWVLYKKRSYPEATKILKRAVSSAPKSRENWSHLGIALFGAGNKDDAFNAFSCARAIPLPQGKHDILLSYPDERKSTLAVAKKLDALACTFLDPLLVKKEVVNEKVDVQKIEENREALFEDIFQQGMAAAQKGDFSKAFEKWKPLAEQGHATSQFNLGIMYDTGRGVSQSYTEGIKWYTLAAKQGFDDAQYNLGIKFFKGQGVAQDFPEAIGWYEKAAEQGHIGAQYNLGVMYYNGNGTPVNLKESFNWNQMAAIQGDAAAQRNVGIHYAAGQGVAKDYVTALMWFDLAANQGDEAAQELVLAHAKRMTYEQILEAKKRSAAWKKPALIKSENEAKSEPNDDSVKTSLVDGTGWEIDASGDFVTLSLEGLITSGERQRFAFKKNNCDQVSHYFSSWTWEPVNFKPFIGKIFNIEFNKEIIGAELTDVFKQEPLIGHILFFNLGGYNKGALLRHLNKNKKITINFVDGDGYKASEYFDVPYNEWSTAGISEAFDKAYQACSQ